MTNSSPSEKSFVFVQLNFWEGRCYYPIVSFLNRIQPDIMAAQEVFTGAQIMPPGYMTQEELIEKQFFNNVSEGKAKPWLIRKGMPYDIRCATFTKGSAKILSHKQIDLHRNLDDMSDTETHQAGYTGLLHSVVELGEGIVVNILNHHERVVIEGRLGSPLVDRNFQMIADYIKMLDGPVILSGDFNIYKEASSLVVLKEMGLRNLNDVYGITSARNAFSWKPEECVSHVFINDQIVVHDYYVAPDLVSDHQPLILRFGIGT